MELFNEMKISDLTRTIMKLNNKRDFALILELWRFNMETYAYCIHICDCSIL